jgi:uncharacterized protein (DUF1499 family)
MITAAAFHSTTPAQFHTKTTIFEMQIVQLQRTNRKSSTLSIRPLLERKHAMKLARHDGPVAVSHRLVKADTSILDQIASLGYSTLWYILILFAFTTNAESSYASASETPASGPSIAACQKSTSNNNNCVSTASVKQVNLFMSPWTWSNDGTISAEEVVGRLKGIIASDQTLSLVESNVDRKDNENYFFRIRAARNVCTDEIEFVVNAVDHIITFRSKQVEGPDNVSDFGANRRRLDDIQKRLTIVTVLGEDMDSADAKPREGIPGQLRAFWGLQSGSGFESILLDEDE